MWRGLDQSEGKQTRPSAAVTSPRGPASQPLVSSPGRWCVRASHKGGWVRDITFPAARVGVVGLRRGVAGGSLKNAGGRRVRGCESAVASARPPLWLAELFCG